MKRCPNCNGSIIRMGHKEKPFFCNSCNEWFSSEEVTPKQTNADRIRQMSDEELAELIGFVAQDAFCYGRGMRDKMLIYPQFGEYDTTIKWLKEEATE